VKGIVPGEYVALAWEQEGRCGEVRRGLDGDLAALTNIYGLHATLRQNGSVTSGNLGGIAPGFGNFACDIKKRGHVVGASAPGTARFTPSTGARDPHPGSWNSAG